MVALGSSFASGPGLEPVADRRAMRSGVNYPHLVAAALDATLIDASVAGATVATILDRPQRMGLSTFAPQIESVPGDATLVTITVGGNDLGYLAGVIRAALSRRLWMRWMPQPVSGDQISDLADGLVAIVEQVRQRAPGARVVLVDYLPVFAAQTRSGPATVFSDDETQQFRNVAAALSSAFRAAADTTGADLIPASAYQAGDDSAQPLIHGLQSLRRIASAFHPTHAGMQAVAQAVLMKLAES